MKYKFLFIFCFAFIVAQSQTNKIDTIPFNINNLLLVFKGTINGIETDFAFDTGASVSVSNSNINNKAKIALGKGKQGVYDTNKKFARIQDIKMDNLTIGSHHFTNLKANTFDMPYLSCANLFLLGQDVIKKFNWKIDFEKKLIYISETAFLETDGLHLWPISYKKKLPQIKFNINGVEYKNCLIDMGFTGIFDVNTKIAAAANVGKSKQEVNKSNLFITSSMGLTGLGKPTNTNYFIIDSLHFGNAMYKNVTATMNENTTTKIGVQFFNKFCKYIILNFSTNTFHIAPLQQTAKNISPLDARVSIKDGKLFISAKNIGNNSSASALEMGEEVKSINGKTIADFKDECDFMLYTYGYQSSEMIIEKLNGEKIVIKRSSNLEY